MAGRYSLFRVALVLGVSFVCSAQVHRISQKTARKLVQAALISLGANGRSVQIKHWPYYWAPEFYTFQAWQPNPGEGPLLTYYFAVNPWTGDVWDAMECKQITSPAIEKEQESIWKHSQIPAEVRESIRNKAPADCSVIQGKTDEKKK